MIKSTSQLELQVLRQVVKVLVHQFVIYLSQGGRVPLGRVVFVHQEGSDPFVKVWVDAAPNHHLELHLQALLQGGQPLSGSHLPVSDLHRGGR